MSPLAPKEHNLSAGSFVLWHLVVAGSRSVLDGEAWLSPKKELLILISAQVSHSCSPREILAVRPCLIFDLAEVGPTLLCSEFRLNTTCHEDYHHKRKKNLKDDNFTDKRPHTTNNGKVDELTELKGRQGARRRECC